MSATTAFVAPPLVAYHHLRAPKVTVHAHRTPPLAARQRRRSFMMLTALLAAMLVFWPIARISRFTHASRAFNNATGARRTHAFRKPSSNNSSSSAVNNATGEAVLLWDKACKNEDVVA